jgi:Fic family protein
MKVHDFNESSPGTLVGIPEGVSAFVPSPLPPPLDWDSALANNYGAAREAVGRLDATLPGHEINPYLIARPLLNREAIYSSQMEGTYTTPNELALLEVDEVDTSHEAREVRNYVLAMERGLELIRQANLPVCHRLIREIHRTLMTGVRGENRRPGEYRDSQNFIGRRIDGLEGARFVPPPVTTMRQAMDALEAYINRPPDDTPLLVDLALIHYQFETIHPFLDGNGRIGRLLVPLMLCERERIRAPLLYISAYLERNKDAYNDLMLRVSTQGDWRRWIVFFLNAIEHSADEAINKAKGLWALRNDYVKKVSAPRLSALLPRLVEELFFRPIITINHAMGVLGVSHAQAASHIRKLERLEILVETTGGSRNLKFLAQEVVRFVYS